MITWFQRVFGKHFKWVLMAVLIVLLLSFIVGIGAVPRGGVDARRQAPLMIFGVNIHDEAQMRPIVEGAEYTLSLTGHSDVSAQDRETFIFARMALKQLADQWGLPQPNQKQFDEYLHTQPFFMTADGTFDNAAYSHFRDQVDAAPANQRNTILSILMENVRLDQVRSVLGGPGYTPSYVAESQLLLGQAKYNLEVAVSDYTKFEPKIDTSAEALEALFAQYPQRFKIPAKARVSYVAFPAPTVPDPTPQQLKDFVAAHKPQFPDVSPDNLGDKTEAVAKAWRDAQKQEAMKAAQSAAMKFARDLFALNTQRTSPDIDALLKKNNLTLQQLPVVTQGKPVPADSPVPDNTLQEVAFGLNPQTFFTSPVPLENGSAIFLYEDSSPSRPAASFAEVRDDVVEAYKLLEKAKQFTARGAEIHDAIVKAMSEGKTFAQAAEAQGLTVKNYPSATYDGLRDAAMEAFNMAVAPAAGKTDDTLASMGPDLLRMFVQPTKTRIPFLYTLRPGETTQMIPIPEQGVFVHVVKREVPALAADSSEVQQILTRLNQQESNANAGFVVGLEVRQARDLYRQDAAARQ